MYARMKISKAPKFYFLKKCVYKVLMTVCASTVPSNRSESQLSVHTAIR